MLTETGIHVTQVFGNNNRANCFLFSQIIPNKKIAEISRKNKHFLILAI